MSDCDVIGARIAHAVLKPLHGFDIVRVNVQARIHDRLDRFDIAAEIRNERFDDDLGIETLDLADRRREMPCAAVLQIIAIHRSQHDVMKPQGGYAFGHVKGSLGSSGGGMRAVLIAQKRQARVQVSLPTMKVAVPLAQHSATLGQCASSQTV